MKPVACARLFEVEALRDGRLTGAERAHFERHLATCAACSREAAELAALGRAIDDSHSASTDELHVRRERTRLLRAFDRTLVAPESPWVARRRLLGLAGVAALIVGLVFFFRLHAGPEPMPAANAVIRADDAARWSRAPQDGRDRIVLERGALWIQVTHAASGPALLVALPDGELEDTGTTFSVTVEAGRTTRVAVEEGSVVLRLHGQSPLAIGRGETWTAVVQPAVSASAPPRVERAPELEPAPPPRMPAASPPKPPSAALARAASNDFRAAVAALSKGENREAAARFARFLERHPRDPRAEDAAYLRVLALQRAGDDTAKQSAALEYLRRYPSGFRQNEVERLAP